MNVIPMSIREANKYVSKWHRHNKAVKVARFACACSEGDEVHGVAIFGTPSARKLTDGLTGEILRVATDGTKNACSILYGACRRAAFALGYRRVVTYTLHSESGSSLRASGFTLETADAGGVDWSKCGKNRKQRMHQDICLEKKNRWAAYNRVAKSVRESESASDAKGDK